MGRKLIDEQWRTYSERVVPANASDAQRMETRNAFYGGAVTLFAAILNSVEPGTEPTDNDLKVFDDLQAEFDDFGAEAEKKALQAKAARG